MKVYCHRAGNDLGLIRPLKAAGFRTVEGDVMFAREEPIMVHPAGLPKRLPDGHLDYSWGEVVQVLVAQGIAVPSLVMMLQLIHEEGMRLLLESKITGTTQRIGDALKPYCEQVTLISFMGDELVDAKDQWSDLRLKVGALMAHSPSILLVESMSMSYDLSMALMDQWYIAPSAVRGFHHNHLRGWSVEVVAYTVNDLERARAMADLGVDAILSDKPRELVDAATGGWLQPG